MGKNIVTKILESHLVEGRLEPGTEIAIRIDQTLTQDATGQYAGTSGGSILYSIPGVATATACALPALSPRTKTASRPPAVALA